MPGSSRARQSNRICPSRSPLASHGDNPFTAPRRHPHHRRWPRSVSDARGAAKRQGAARANQEVSRLAGKARRVLHQHPRQARSLHGRRRDDQDRRAQPREGSRRRDVVSGFADGVLSDQCRCSGGSRETRSGGDRTGKDASSICTAAAGCSRCNSRRRARA